ncbi:MAG: methyltransferase domain-containing protein [Pseudobdellovibrio sp.]
MNHHSDLTTNNYWNEYWDKFKATTLDENIFFKKLTHFFPKSEATNRKNFIEVGGFPGVNSAYFYKFLNYNPCLVDYIIREDIIHQVEQKNVIPLNTIKTFSGNIHEIKLKEKYDLVFSAGFIEHFKDTEIIFDKHVEFMKEDGSLFISVPNFKGIYGLVQKWLDKETYDLHNIDCMDLNVFQNLCNKHNLKIQFLDYYGIPHLWLEHPEKVNAFTRKFIRLITLVLMKTGSLLKGKFFSLYIVLIAKKQSNTD